MASPKKTKKVSACAIVLVGCTYVEVQYFLCALQLHGGFSCAVAKCPNVYGSSDEISFHTFPKSELLRSQWTAGCKRVNEDRSPWIPGKSSRICSDHFTQDAYRTCSKSGKFYERKILRVDALPTLFRCAAGNSLSHTIESPKPTSLASRSRLRKKKSPSSVHVFEVTRDMSNEVNILRENLNNALHNAACLRRENEMLGAEVVRLRAYIAQMNQIQVPFSC